MKLKNNSFICLLIGVIIFFITSCGNNDSDKTNILKSISDYEKMLYGNKDAINFDIKIANELTTKYNLFAKKFPDDNLTPNYMFKSAEVLRSLRKFNEAAGIYKKIGLKYPNYEKAPHSLFLLGFSFENDLKNLEDARKCYNEFLAKYPKHELADDVTFSLKNLGKSPDEIIKAFEESRKQKEGINN